MNYIIADANFYVTNQQNTANINPPNGGFLNNYRNILENTAFPNRCSRAYCRNRDFWLNGNLHGAHVINNNNNNYIVPLCVSHNNHTITEPFRLISGSVLVRAELFN
jgi:hypothetical protein